VHELARVLEKPEWGNRTGVATVGGLVVAELSRIPARGEELAVDGVRLRVLETDGKTVRRVQAMGSGPDPAC
jgi:CBS domain containing-hemolysin-like protein